MPVLFEIYRLNHFIISMDHQEGAVNLCVVVTADSVEQFKQYFETRFDQSSFNYRQVPYIDNYVVPTDVRYECLMEEKTEPFNPHQAKIDICIGVRDLLNKKRRELNNLLNVPPVPDSRGDTIPYYSQDISDLQLYKTLQSECEELKRVQRDIDILKKGMFEFEQLLKEALTVGTTI